MMAWSQEDLHRQARFGSAGIRPRPIPKRWIAANWLIATGTEAVRPIARKKWPRRRRRLRGAVYEALFRVLVMDSLVRWSARQTLRRAEVEQRLRQELGRPPWPEEVERALTDDR